MIEIDFTKLEIWACRELAKNIRKNKTKELTDNTWDGVRFEERNYKGIKGAYAVSKFLECDFDRELWKGKDNGWDIKYRGVPLEVKNLQLYLAFNNLNHFKCDVAVLVNPIKDSEKVKLVGWTDKNNFIKNNFKMNFGYGDRLCINHESMFPMEDLKNLDLKREFILNDDFGF